MRPRLAAALACLSLRAAAAAQPTPDAAGSLDAGVAPAGAAAADGGADEALPAEPESAPVPAPPVGEVTRPESPPRAAESPTEPEEATAEEDEWDPLDFDVHGYYRLRGVMYGNLPQPSATGGVDPARQIGFGFMRLRVIPSISYQPRRRTPSFTLIAHVDALDNVLLGQNAIVDPPTFLPARPSTTDLFGDDVPPLQVSRLWLKVAHPAGELGIGRMPFDLFGLRDAPVDYWGDHLFAGTVDGLYLTVRPLTIVRWIGGGEPEQHPLELTFAYDHVVEDAGDSYPPYVGSSDDEVRDVAGGAGWTDLAHGVYIGGGVLRRTQRSTDTSLWAANLIVNVRWSLGADAPALVVDAEFLGIFGTTFGLPVGIDFDPTTGRSSQQTTVRAWYVRADVGVAAADGRWLGSLEIGYVPGDDDGTDDGRLTAFGFNPDEHVGLVLFHAALSAHRTGLVFGSVENAHYLFPQGRYRPLDWLELATGVVVAWADVLDPWLVARGSGNTGCGVAEADCFLGWEWVGGVHFVAGDLPATRWTVEGGIAQAGAALADRLTEPIVVTVQGRAALMW